MKSLRTLLKLCLGAAGAFVLLGGCVAGDGYVASGTVYGGFGYAGPVGYDEPGYVEGGFYAHPPYGHDDHRDVHADPHGPAPRAPSIPTAPRPNVARPVSRSGDDRQRR
jgi:hypothetical protein